MSANSTTPRPIDGLYALIVLSLFGFWTIGIFAVAIAFLYWVLSTLTTAVVLVALALRWLWRQLVVRF